MQLWTARKSHLMPQFIYRAVMRISYGKKFASLHLVADPHNAKKWDWLFNFNNNLQIKRTNLICALIMYIPPYILDIWILWLKVGFYCDWLLLLQSQGSCGVSDIFFKMSDGWLKKFQLSWRKFHGVPNAVNSNQVQVRFGMLLSPHNFLGVPSICHSEHSLTFCYPWKRLFSWPPPTNETCSSTW